MTEQEVIDLMSSATSDEDWNQKTLQVKRAFNNGYPAFWYPAIIASGLGDKIAAKWGGSTGLQIKIFNLDKK